MSALRIDEAGELKAMLSLHEGTGPVRNGRLYPYRDTTGHTTIGIGRNLDGRGISVDEAFMMLDNDISETYRAVESSISFFDNLDTVRRLVLLDMCFNLGISGLLRFKRMLMALEEGEYTEAARQMRKSKWYGQVGTRAVRLTNMMETGELE